LNPVECNREQTRKTTILRCFALRGNPSREIAGVREALTLSIIHSLPGGSGYRARPPQEGVMDLAMAMGVALFGMFAVSTVYFFYKLER
jgi:hypothetical protein